MKRITSELKEYLKDMTLLYVSETNACDKLASTTDIRDTVFNFKENPTRICLYELRRDGFLYFSKWTKNVNGKIVYYCGYEIRYPKGEERLKELRDEYFLKRGIEEQDEQEWVTDDCIRLGMIKDHKLIRDFKNYYTR